MVASVFSVLNKLFDLAPPLLIGVAVDTVVERQDSLLASLGIVDLRTQLLVLAGITAVIWIFESLFEYLFQLGWRNLAQTVQHELRLDAYGHVQGLEQGFFEDRSTGGLLAILNDDVNQLERFLDRGANEILQVLTTVVVISGAFFVVAPGIAWFAMAPIPIILWGTLRFQRMLEPRYAAVREQVGTLNASLSNNLSGIATSKAFTAEDRETERIAVDSEEYRQRNGDAIRLSSLFVPLIRMAILVGFLFILVLGGLRVLAGDLAVGVYSVGIFIVQRLLWPLTRLGETFDLYQHAMASTRRILDLLAVEPEITDGPLALPGPTRGELRLAGVRFAYADGAEVLRGLDLHVPAGSTTAIVGATGAGKSTVVKLLLRLYDPQAGSITLGGIELRDLRLDDLRSAFGLVSQDVSCSTGPCGRTSLTAGPARVWPTSPPPPVSRRRTTSSRRCQGGTTPWSGSEGRSCRAGSASACRSRVPSWRTRRCCCSTKPRPRSTTRPKPPSSGRWPRWRWAARCWSSPTGCRRSATPTGSTSWRPGASSSRARTTSCWSKRGCTRHCGESRPATSWRGLTAFGRDAASAPWLSGRPPTKGP